ncbi:MULTISPECIES: late competence protein ComER [unclassified Paenibacillus]|uniref:late competence protein ComER n=1 Tax=unclassified Paenibacillus TaxID=185978 RepID=UPI0009546F02|nr:MULTISPECIES: late competence protein ComER [unclassified Paenibacillus]ASS66079.1 late competence protein ComER [Paenibacillus sp. RUD330]SIQ13219.1 competence protein ComER [Paenibacillus sp. RU4X]SIQ34995.1 competence protein ComER [Paenibacillus sp. RU4T]
MKIGFIGTGSMGSLLVDSFIRSGAVEASDVVVANRTFHKAERLAAQHPGVAAVPSSREAAQRSDCLFLCVKPSEFKSVLQEIQPSVRSDQVVVSITSAVLISHLEDQLPCRIAKIIPSITNGVLSGASLCMFGSRMTVADCCYLEGILSRISEPLLIDEQYTRIVSDLSSCGPAFISFLLQRLIDAAVEMTGIDPDEAVAISSAMLLGTGKLLTEGGMTPDELIRRVSVPGGITQQGLQLLRQETDGMFQKLIRITHDKFREDLEKVEASLYGEEVNGP